MRKEGSLSRLGFVKAAMTLSVVVLFLFASPSLAFAQQWRYALLQGPSSYPLRWGEREPPNEDMVAMPPGLDTSRTIPTSPGCYKVGTSGFVLSYKVEDSTLRGAIDVVVWDEVTGEVLWSKTYSRVPKEGSISLEGLVLPSYITMLGFQVSWSGSGSMFTRFNVFVVLDAPKAPMDPAWVSVLRISCRWARGESTSDGAANMLAQKLWENGEYNGGYTTFTRYVCDGSGNFPSDASEYFYLKAFINSGFVGQCNDFADFLVCLITSVGAFQAAAQRTHPLNLGWWFHFREIDPAGSPPPQEGDWSYHQFCIYGTDIWDGCIAFVAGSPQGPPKKLPRDTIYYNGLVAYYGNGHWQPSPSNGFLPGVYAFDTIPSCRGPCGSRGYGPSCPSP